MIVLYGVIGLLGVGLVIQAIIDLSFIRTDRKLNRRIDELLKLDVPRPHRTPDRPLGVEQILLRLRGEEDAT